MEDNKLTLPVMGQPELTSINAREDEKETYKRAYSEQQQGILTPADYMDSRGRMYGITKERQEGLRGPMRAIEKEAQELLVDQMATEIGTPRLMSAEEIMKSGTPVTENREYMSSMAAGLMPEFARQRELAEKYAGVGNGTKTYEEFLIEAYGRDALKALGHHTDSVAYWKSQFREGNYQHPLDNEAIRRNIIQTADQMFQLESFYNQLTANNHLDGLSEYVGKELDEGGYRAFFGEDWDKILTRVGDYESAVRYYKAGYLGDAVDQMVYAEYDAEGNGVGDPVYYVDQGGRVYELVANEGQAIDKSRQMYLMKNADGSLDRLTQKRTELGEFWGAMANGFIGAATGVVDVLGMALIGVGTGIHQALGGEGTYKDDFLKNYTEFYAFMNNNVKSAAMRVNDLDTNAWDASNVVRGAGTAVGYVAEIALEIFLSAGVSRLVAELGKQGGKVAVTAAMRSVSAKIMSELGEAAAKKTVKELTEKGFQEMSESVVKKIIAEGGQEAIEKLMGEAGKEATEAAAQAFVKETMEKAVTALGKEAVQETVENGITRSTYKFMDQAVQIQIMNNLNGQLAANVTKEAALRTFGRYAERKVLQGIEVGFKLSNSMKMLNSGSFGLATKAFEKFVNRKWASTVSRATVNFALTVFETSVNQYARQQYDTELETSTIWRNALLAGGIAAASTLVLSSSLDDHDNMSRFIPDNERSAMNTAMVKARLALKRADVADITEDMVKKKAWEMFKAESKFTLEMLNKFSVGQYMRNDTILRTIGGISEFVDNIVTTSTRNSANLGVRNVFGDGGLIDMKAMSSPDVILPALLSSAKSVMGRRNLFGLAGVNEGSFNDGAAASKADAVKMFTDTDTFLAKLEVASRGTDEHEAILNVQNQVRLAFKNGMETYGDEAFAALDVMSMLADKVQASGATDVMSKLDIGFMQKLSQTEAFKTAAKNGLFEGLNIVNKNGELKSDFSFKSYVGRHFANNRMEQDLAMQEAIIAKYEVREMMLQNALDRKTSGNYNKMKQAIANGLRRFFGATNITKDAAAAQLRPVIQEAMRIYGVNFTKNEDIDTLVERFMQEGFNPVQQAAETQLLMEHIYNMGGEMLEKHFEAKTLSSAIIDGLKGYKELRADLKKQFPTLTEDQISDVFKQAKDIIYAKKGKKVPTAGALDNEVKFLVKAVKEASAAMEADIKKFGISRDDKKKIVQNAMLADNPPETLNAHVKNGVVINLFGKNFKQDDADPINKAYRESVKAICEVINKTSDKTGPQDFLVLGDESDGKIFIATPKPIDNLLIKDDTIGVVQRMVQDMMVIRDPKSTPEGTLAALRSITQFMGHDNTTYADMKAAHTALQNGQSNIAAFVGGVNFLMTNGHLSSLKVMQAVVDNNGDDGFLVEVRKQFSSANNVDPNSPLSMLFTFAQKIREFNQLTQSTEVTQERFNKLYVNIETLTGGALATFLSDPKNKELRGAYGFDEHLPKLKDMLAQLKQGGVGGTSNFPLTQEQLDNLSKVLKLSSAQTKKFTKEQFSDELRKQKPNDAAVTIGERRKKLSERQQTRVANAEQLRTLLVEALGSHPGRQALTQDVIKSVEQAVRDDIATRPNGQTIETIDGSYSIQDAKVVTTGLVHFVLGTDFGQATGTVVGEVNNILYDPANPNSASTNGRVSMTEIVRAFFEVVDEPDIRREIFEYAKPEAINEDPAVVLAKIDAEDAGMAYRKQKFSVAEKAEAYFKKQEAFKNAGYTKERDALKLELGGEIDANKISKESRDKYATAKSAVDIVDASIRKMAKKTKDEKSLKIVAETKALFDKEHNADYQMYLKFDKEHREHSDKILEIQKKLSDLENSDKRKEYLRLEKERNDAKTDLESAKSSLPSLKQAANDAESEYERKVGMLDVAEPKKDELKDNVIAYVQKKLLGKKAYDFYTDPQTVIQDAIDNSPELRPFRDQLKKWKTDSYKSLDSFLADVENQIKAHQLFTDYEENMFALYKLSEGLYSRASVFPPETTRVRVNFGELKAAVENIVMRRFRQLNNAKEFGVNPNDMDILVDKLHNVDRAFAALNKLKRLFASAPVVEYDLTDTEAREKFNNLMVGVLGLSLDDLHDASMNSTHKLPGVTFNNDSSAIVAKNTAGKKYKSVKELYSKEMNPLRFQVLERENSFFPDAMGEVLRSAFPFGIVGITENSKLSPDGKQFRLVQGFTPEAQRVYIGHMAQSAIEVNKSGKSASAKNATSGFVYSTLDFSYDNDPAFVNFLILKSIADQIAFGPDAMKNQVNQYIVTKDMDHAALKAFGWRFEENEAKKPNGTYITGFDPVTNAEFFKTQSKDTVNVFKCLPVGKTLDNGKTVIDLNVVTDGGSNAARIVGEFHEQLETINIYLRKQSKDTGGEIPLLKNAELTQVKIEDGWTFKQAIDKYKNSTNISERALVATLESALFASKAYSKFLEERFGDKAKGFERIGELVSDNHILKTLFDKQLSEEEKLRLINEYLTDMSKNIKPGAFETDVPVTDGFIPVKKNIVYASEIDYSKYSDPKNLIQESDLQNLKMIYASPFIQQQEAEMSSSIIDHKNRFLAMVYEGKDGNFYVPVSNLIKIRTDDLNEDVGNNLKLGTWIKQTFGNEFYDNVLATLQQYDKIYPSRRVNKLNYSEVRISRNTLQVPSTQINPRAVLENEDYATELAENNAENKETLRERAEMDDDLISAAEVGGQAKSAMTPFSDEQIRNVDDYSINPNDTSARTMTVNVGQKLAAIRQLENTMAVNEALKNNAIGSLPKMTPEETDQLTRHIVTLATINSGEQRKASFIVGVKNDKGVTFETVTATKGDPFTALFRKLIEVQSLEPNSESFIIHIDEGFTLRNPTEDSADIKVISLGGTNAKLSNGGTTMQSLLTTMFLETWYKDHADIAATKTAAEIQQAMLEDFSARMRIQEQKNFYVKTFRARLKTMGLSDEYADQLVSVFKHKTDEIAWTSGGKSMTKSSIENTYANTGGDIFKQRDRNLSIKKLQGMIFDGIDISKFDDGIHKILDDIFDYEDGEYRTKNMRTNQRDEMVELAVKNIKAGIKEQMPRMLQFDGSPDYARIADVIKRYTISTDNSAMQKLALLSTQRANALLAMAKDRKNKAGSFLVDVGKKAGRAVRLSLSEIVSNPKNIRVFFDCEWSYPDDSKHPDGKKAYQVHLTVVDGGGTSEQTFWIKPDDATVVAVKESKDSSRGLPYSGFSKFLSDNKKDADFFETATGSKALSKQEAGKQILAYLNKLVSTLSPTEKTLLTFIGHNSKGKDSDLDVIRNTFNAGGSNLGDEIVKLIGGENNPRVNHVDFFNDVLKQYASKSSNIDASKNRKDLTDLFESLPKDVQDEFKKDHVSNNGAHSADYDTAMLKVVFDHYENFIESGVKASTQALDFVGDIFKSLTGKNMSDNDVKELSKILNFSYGKTKNAESEAIIQKWDDDVKKTNIKIQKEIIEMYEYFQKRIERVRQFADINEKIDTEVGYDSEFIRAFFENRNEEGAKTFRRGINLLFDTMKTRLTPDESIDDSHQLLAFVTKLSDLVGKIYGDDTGLENSRNKQTQKVYNPKAFRSFYLEFAKDPVATINKILELGNDKRYDKFELVTEDQLNKQVLEKNDAANRIIDNKLISDDFAFNSTLQGIAYKTAPLLNGLIFSLKIDGSTREELVNQMFRLVSAVKEPDVGFADAAELKDIIKKRQEELNFKGTTLSDYLKQLAVEGFKDHLSSWGLYSKASESSKEQMDAYNIANPDHKIDTTVGKIFATEAWMKNMFGMTLAEYKQQHGLERVFISVKRDPSDKFDTYHAYEILEDRVTEKQNIPLISMNRIELYSKHSGDFDGDAVTLYLPNDNTQKLYGKYNDKGSQLIDLMNKPYIMADYLMGTVYDWANQKGMSLYPETMRDDFALQSALALYLHNNADKMAELMDILKRRDMKSYDAFCLKLGKNALPYIKDAKLVASIFKNDKGDMTDDEVITKVKNNFIQKYENDDGYFVHNKYLLADHKSSTYDPNSLALNKLLFTDQYIQLAKELQFKSAINMRDQLTGMFQKETIPEELVETRSFRYNPFKFAASEMKLIEAYLADQKASGAIADLDAFKKFLKKLGVRESAANRVTDMNAVNLYQAILFDEYVLRNSKEFHNAVDAQQKKIFDGKEPTEVEQQIRRINEMAKDYEKYMPIDFFGGRLFPSNKISMSTREDLIGLMNDMDERSNAQDKTLVMTAEIAVQEKLGKKVTVLVDKENYHKINIDQAMPTSKFAERTVVYTSVSYNRFEHDRADIKIPNSKLVSSSIVGNDVVEIYSRPIDRDVKIMAINGGRFGKMTQTAKTLDSNDYLPYDLVISQEQMKNLSPERSPNADVKIKKDVIIDGKTYGVVEYTLGIAEDIATWDKSLQQRSIDMLSLAMNSNSIGLIPFANGALATVNKDGTVEMNLDQIRDVVNVKARTHGKDLYEANFMSPYNQLRGLIAVDWMLAHANGDEDLIQRFTENKAELETTDRNWAGSTGWVNDIIREVNEKSGGEFFNSLTRESKDDPYRFKSKLFSYKLFQMAVGASFPFLDMSAYTKKIDDARSSDEAKSLASISGKGSAFDKVYNDFDHQMLGATVEGEAPEAMIGGTPHTYLHMPAIKAMNFLLQGNEYLSFDDVLEGVRHGIFSVGEAVRPSIATGYVALDKNQIMFHPEANVPASLKNYGVKTGAIGHIAGGIDVRPQLGMESGYGKLNVIDNEGSVYFDSMDPQTNRIFNENIQFDSERKIPDGQPILGKVNLRNGRFANALASVILPGLSTNDRMLRSVGKHRAKYSVTFGGTKVAIDGSELKNKASFAAISAGNMQDLEKELNQYYNLGAFYNMAGDVQQYNKTLADKKFLSQDSIRDASDTAAKQKETLSALEKDLSNKKIEALVRRVDDKNNAQKIADKLTIGSGPGVPDTKTALYKSSINSADVTATKIVYDPLHQSGIAAKDFGSYEVGQGITNLHNYSKTYLEATTAPLQVIKQMIGNDLKLADEFDKFTQARYAQLAYKEAMTEDDPIIKQAAKEMLFKIGYVSIEHLEQEMKSFIQNNAGLAQMYERAIFNLEKLAKEDAVALNISENVDELFLLHPFMAKRSSDPKRKVAYYSTLNSVFLNKKPSLSDMIIKATEYSFSDSVYYLAANLAKVKAMEDAKDYFKRAGVIENSAVYSESQKVFEQELAKLGETKPHALGRTLKAQIIQALNASQDGVHLNIDDNYADKNNFFELVYKRIVETKNQLSIGTKYRDMNIVELSKAFNESNDVAEQSLISSLIRIEKIRRDFMADTIALNKGMGDAIAQRIESVASAKGGVLTNEYMQMLPREKEGRSSFSFLTGFDLKTIRDSYDFINGGDTEADRIAYMAISGNMYVTNEKLAQHMDKYFFTEKVPTAVEDILNKTKGGFTKFIMSMPHKLIQRITQYSIGDIAQITLTDPSCIKDILPTINEMTAFFESKGATMKRGSELELFLQTSGFDPFAYHNKSLNLDTMEYENSAKLGKGYFAVAEKFFTAQTLASRYALWKSLYKRFNDFDANPSKDRRLYGPLYSEKQYIDKIGTNAEKAREIVYATLGGPNGFALLARKELNNIGMFLTFPMALLRTGIGHLKSIQSSFSQLIDGSANNATKRYLGSTALGIGGTQILAGLFIAAISSFYGVDKETEEEWKKKATYIDPFLTLLNDRPVAATQASTGLYAMLREMFYEPFEAAEGNIFKGGVNWFSANVIGRLNPLFKTPLELMLKKDFIGPEGPTDTTSRNFYDNVTRKILSTFIGASGAIAMSDQWYYTKLGEENPMFIKQLGLSLYAAVLGEAGHYRGYKTEMTNYYKALSLIRGYRKLEQVDETSFGYADNGFSLTEMSDLAQQIKRAMDKEQPSSVIYGIIDEAIKDGASASTVKAALFNNSISGKLSQLKDITSFIGSLTEKNKTVLEDAIKYEEQHYSILKTIVSEYLKQNKSYSYNKVYVPKNYYTYPSYDSSKYKSYYQYQNSWFKDKRWNNYAKQYLAYRSKKNFVPNLTDFTGKFAKDFYDYREPRVRDPKGEVETRRYNENSRENDDNSLYTNSKAGAKGR